MAEFARDYRVLVLDDASTDGTGEALARYSKVLPITRIRSDQPLGYARALERLLREAVAQSSYPKRDAVVTLQGDFTEDPSDIIPMIKAMEGGADIVAGSLTEERYPLPKNVRWVRRLSPWFFRRLHRLSPAADPLVGFRAYRVIVLKKMLRDAGEKPLLNTQGWAANVELLSLATPHARRIDEAPLEMRYHLLARESRVKPVKILKDLMQVRGVRWLAPSPTPTPSTEGTAPA
jgi:glycosyltransferase involved in cell wall biosynthesis